MGIGLTGLGVPYAIDVAIWLLAVGSVFTVGQRLIMAAQSPRSDDLCAPPTGVAETTSVEEMN